MKKEEAGDTLTPIRTQPSKLSPLSAILKIYTFFMYLNIINAKSTKDLQDTIRKLEKTTIGTTWE